MTTPRRRVVLHFDLNRTVLMSDAAGGRSMENTVNYLLAECTWGRVEGSAWRCVSTESSIAPPPASEPLTTYKQFVDAALPYKSLKDAADLDQVKAFNKAAKKQRTALQSAFTESGGPGEPVVKSFHEVMRKLHFPEGEQREAAQRVAATLPASRLQEAWSEGRYYLLPSFLKFLEHVAQINATSDAYDIKLVFRTFGDDIPEVAKELELLVDGKHPFQLSAPLPASFKLTPSGDQVGTFYRDGFGADGTALAIGSLTKVPFTKANQGDASALESFYAEQKQSVEIVRGFTNIKRRLDEMVHTHATLALRDYWEWWSAHAEAGEYGKLLLLDAGRDDEISVFFDDHIEAHHAHIVDVRDVSTGEPVPFAESKQRRFLQRVEPFAAITDEQYFISLVQSILQK